MYSGRYCVKNFLSNTSYAKQPLVNGSLVNQIHLQDAFSSHGAKWLSSGEAFTALKPFFFAVHPDLFGQHPKERAVNENSLKQLNAYIETASVRNSPPQSPTNLVFYLRSDKSKEKNAERKTNFQSIHVNLGTRDVRKTVHSILEKCNLPTSYVDSLPVKEEQKTSFKPFEDSQVHYDIYYSKNDENAWRDEFEAEIQRKKALQDKLEKWLVNNVEIARKKLDECWPIREEIVKLRKNICDNYGIKDVVWDCGWGTRHFRGCLQSFNALASHHPDVMEVLKGKTVVFGRETGVSLGGHVILNSGEVRSNWLDLIKQVRKHDAFILRIPSVQKALSRALQDIKVVHRKFEPTKLADSYETHLKKLTTSIGDYRGRKKFPSSWPKSLSHLELVVETAAGPLMLSPTGQIIVPSSCPTFLLVNFISENMEEASHKLAQYKKQKYLEIDIHAQCMKEFGLVALQKDDNVTPDLMIDCCNRLLKLSHDFRNLLQGTHLWITSGYYSVLSDGELCIPWDWNGSRIF